MGADFYENDQSIERDTDSCLGIGDGAVIDGALVDKNVHIGDNARIVAAKASGGNGDYDAVCMNDGIAIVRKGATVAAGWKFGS